MQKYLDPRNDVIFKLLFTAPENKSLLISFLEAVIRPLHPIADITLLKPEIGKDSFSEKASVLDILVELDNGIKIDVEMQMASNALFKKRLLYYWAKLHARQLNVGYNYTKLVPTISIAILATEEFKNCPNTPHSIFEMRERNRNELYSNDLEIHFLELPKLSAWTKDNNLHYTKLEGWMLFLNIEIDPAICIQKFAKDPIMSKALKALEIISRNPDARTLAERRENARLNYESGMENAAAEGEARGEAKGEAKEQLNTINKLLKKGLSPEEISSLLDLDLEKVLTIFKSLKRLENR